MAEETVEETLARLDALANQTPSRNEGAWPRQPVGTLSTEAGEDPAATLARLEALIEAENRKGRPSPRIGSIAGIPLPEAVSEWTGPIGGSLSAINQGIGNLAGFLATPVAGPLTRPAEGTTARAVFEGSTGEQQRADDLSRSQQLVQNFLQRVGAVPEGFDGPQGIIENAAAGMVPALAVTGAMLAGGPGAARLAGSAALSRAGLPTSGTFAPYTSRIPGPVGEFATATGRAAGEIGLQVAARPVTAARAVLTGEAGAGLAREAARPAIEGALPGTDYPTLAAAGRSALLFGTEVLGGIPTTFLGRAIPVPVAERINPFAASSPIIPPNADPDVAGGIIRARQVQVVDAIDRSVARAIERAGEPGLSEAQSSINLREGLLSARQYAKSEVDRAWNDIDLSVTGPAQRTLETIDQMLYEAALTPGVADNFPVQRLRALQQQLLDVVTPGGAGLQRNTVPLRELNQIRSTVLRDSDIAAETSILQPRPNLPLQGNLNRLVDAITQDMDVIGSAASANFRPAIEYARSASRMYHERFTRGPVGELLMMTRQSPFAQPGQPVEIGTARVPPTQVARELLNPNETAAAVYQAAQRFGRQLANPPIGGAAQARVARTADEAIRTMFHDDILDHYTSLEAVAQKPRAIEDIPTTTSTQRGPVASAALKAQRWIEKNAPLLNGYVNTTTQLFNTASRLNRLLRAHDAQVTNVAQQFLGRPTANVIQESLSAPNVGERFASLFRQYRNVPEVIEGLQRGLIDNIFSGHGVDPSTALTRLRQPNYNAALTALFSNDPTKLDRLYEMVRGAAGITGLAVSATSAGKASIVPKKVQLTTQEWIARGLATQIGGIFGLWAGGAAARLLMLGSAGSLSIPMRSNRFMRNLIASTWLKDREYALSIVKDAVFDTGFEAWLRDGMPNGLVEARKSLAKLERVLRQTNYVINGDVDEYLVNNGRRLYIEERRRMNERAAEIRKNPFSRD